MKGKVCIVTGGSSGIGKQTALALAKRGATVVIISRDVTKGRMAEVELRQKSGNSAVQFFAVDLSVQAEIRAFAARYREMYGRLDILINNAGVINKIYRQSEDGYEYTFAVNHLAPFLLTHLLLEVLVRTEGARIINVASQVYSHEIDFDNMQGEKGFDGMQAYRVTKLANILFTYELSRRLAGSGVTVNCLHPGVVQTPLYETFEEFRNPQPKRGTLLSRFSSYSHALSPEDGAQTIIYLATSPDVADISGQYFVGRMAVPTAGITYDEVVAHQLWEHSEVLVGLDEAREDEDIYAFPASFAQQRLWFVEQLDAGRPVYNIPSAFRLRGRLDIDALAAALNSIIDRHESLRTTFTAISGEPVQVIQPELKLPLPVIDLGHMPGAELEAEIDAHILRESRWTFDYERGPLLRAVLLRIREDEHIFVVTLHHIIADGWSLSVFANELSVLYVAHKRNEPSLLPELPVQYADYVMWQKDWMQGAVLKQQQQYWVEKLVGAQTLMALPTDRPRKPIQSADGAWEPISLEPELVAALKELSRKHGVSLYMTLLTAFKILIQRYTRQDDIVIGAPTAGRPQTELENLIGFFVNPIVLRSDLSGNPTFTTLLQQVRTTVIEATTHQDIPFERLVEILKPERNLSYHPLFQISFTLQNPPLQIDLNGIETEVLAVDNKTAKFDLLVELWESDGGIQGKFEYDTDLFDQETIARLMGHYAALLRNIVVQPSLSIGQYSILPTAENRQLVHAWNDTAMPLPAGASLHQLFEEQVARTPDALAVTFGEQTLTYRELNAYANQLAYYLRDLGVKPDDFVGICVDRSLDMIVGLLAILKAGGAYLPLDPTYPNDRLAFMIEDAQAGVLLTQAHLTAGLPPNNAHVLNLDNEWSLIGGYPTANLSPVVTDKNLAYVIHTSGSTGKPKGVQIEHGNVVNFLLTMRERPGLTADDVVIAVTTLSFDIAVLELYLPLITGARVVIAGKEEASDGNALVSLIDAHGVTVMQATPATWQMMLATGWAPPADLTVLCGGEALPRKLANELLVNGATLWNMYGPTETTVWSSVERIERGDEPILIGRPIGNTDMYIVDDKLNPVPVGVPGELYIGGTGVARGYLNRSELTAERFIRNPFHADPAARIYRTGDLARYMPDGRIECLGRIDFQVKVRGFRIELGEIEAILNQHPAVAQAVVNAVADDRGDKRLVGYIQYVEGEVVPSVITLRQHLGHKLPQYMIPNAFIQMDTFPLTPNGKVNRRALPNPNYDQRDRDHFVAPRTDTEKAIASIWAQVLRIERVGLQDSFFELGGHSLLAAQMMAQVHAEFAISLPLAHLFEAPHVEEFASRVDMASWANQDGGTAVSVLSDEEEWEAFEL